MTARKPDFVVYGMSLDGDHWKQIGVGWRRKSKTKAGYVRIALDFMPNTRDLTVWMAEDRPEAAVKEVDDAADPPDSE